MGEYDRGRKQYALGLTLVTIITPLAAVCAAIAAAVGALLTVKGRKRMENSRAPDPAAATPALRAAATRRPERGATRGPQRRHGTTHPRGITH
ncbi:hypothetical protein ACIP5Y_02020 [Nocardia sp. NPDC088792]|uniref:hypothetical protein n=1 Tax=Nocardia sp. NPDC088792 TaxID=3364332 RepID=UPI0037FE7CE7